MRGREGLWSALAPLLVYAGAAGLPFKYDDPFFLRALGAFDAAGKGWLQLVRPEDLSGVMSPSYFPAGWALLRLLRLAFGELAPAFHLAAVLLHVLAARLVFGLGRRLLGSPSRALAASLLFSLHPALASTVLVPAHLYQPLGACAGLGALLCLFELREGPRRDLAAAGLFAMAVLSKEAYLMLLPAAGGLLAAGLPPGEAPRMGRRLLALLGGVAAAYLGLRLWQLSALGDLRASPGSELAAGSSLRRLLLAARLWGFPTRLLHLHGDPGWALLKSPGAWAGAALTAASLLGSGRHGRGGALWALAMLFPALGLVSLASAEGHLDRSFFAERYLYPAAPGLAWAAGGLGRGLPARRLRAGAAVALAACAAWTLAQVRRWADFPALVADAARAYPGNALLRLQHAEELRAAGKRTEACAEFRAALGLAPSHARDRWTALREAGACELREGRPSEAERLLRESLRLEPGQGRAWIHLAKALGALGRGEEAKEARAEALRREPLEDSVLFGLAEDLAAAGRAGDALGPLSLLDRRHPRDPGVQELYGECLLRLGRPREALSRFERALLAEPGRAGALMGAARAGAALGTPGP